MNRDRWLLVAAYIILVLTTAWSAWSTSEALDRIEEDVCATAEVAVAGQLLNLGVYGQQDGVNVEALRITITTLVTIVDAIQNRCGDIFLDDLEVPDFEPTD